MHGVSTLYISVFWGEVYHFSLSFIPLLGHSILYLSKDEMKTSKEVKRDQKVYIYQLHSAYIFLSMHIKFYQLQTFRLLDSFSLSSTLRAFNKGSCQRHLRKLLPQTSWPAKKKHFSLARIHKIRQAKRGHARPKAFTTLVRRRRPPIALRRSP